MVISLQGGASAVFPWPFSASAYQLAAAPTRHALLSPTMNCCLGNSGKAGEFNTARARKAVQDIEDRPRTSRA